MSNPIKYYEEENYHNVEGEDAIEHIHFTKYRKGPRIFGAKKTCLKSHVSGPLCIGEKILLCNGQRLLITEGSDNTYIYYFTLITNDKSEVIDSDYVQKDIIFKHI